MVVQVVETDQRAFAFRALLERLGNGPLVVATDSCVAAAIGVDVSNRIMASALHRALGNGWVMRHRDRDVRDHYDNPVAFKLTTRGREQLGQLATR